MFFSNTIDEALLNLIFFFSVWKTIFLSMCNCWENCAPKEPVHISLLLRVIESVCIFVWNSCAFIHLMNPPHSLCVNVLDGSHCRGVRVDECYTHLSLSLSLSLHGTIIIEGVSLKTWCALHQRRFISVECTPLSDHFRTWIFIEDIFELLERSSCVE